MNTADFLELSSAMVPDRAALICEDTVKTYTELSAEVTRLANALQGPWPGARRPRRRDVGQLG